MIANVAFPMFASGLLWIKHMFATSFALCKFHVYTFFFQFIQVVSNKKQKKKNKCTFACLAGIAFM